MTLSAKAEQSLTHRPNSYVPGKTLARLFNLDFHAHPDRVNHATHWGQGMLAAGVRGAMAYYGVVGPFASYLFMGVRLLIDQTLENWMGVGALPWTWPVNEQIIDLLHKAVFAAVTGHVADRIILGEALNA
ncbi:uncharacterized protein A1O5_05372 [Cladophialophora psammophila CBS 110553]|uniref:Uncharacterized protein n=1 Tax=Cladophialophora psammophila CBS 110553 TaxID=1182543 RepID=W9XMI9_9EURO|nr:uncharacterized protein A1O5_05372 [Cladophialophora psammophila CBS 110553]EXJ71564.1 hypothetical protein A1O5_05372 [Cladophialophora psammophila CBS 110553]